MTLTGSDGVGKTRFAPGKRLVVVLLVIFQSIGDLWGLACIYFNLGNMAWFQGDPLSQRVYLEKSLAVCREAGDLHGIAIALDILAFAIAYLGYLQAGRI